MRDTFSRTSILGASPAQVWAEVKTTRLLHDVATPLLVFRLAPGEAWPELWTEGATLRLRLYALGVVPLGPHTLTIARMDEAARQLQTREHGPLLRYWEHRIEVTPAGPGHARYTDEVSFDAGRLTPIVGVVARAFFAHRHRRWRSVIDHLGGASLRPSSPASPLHPRP